MQTLSGTQQSREKTLNTIARAIFLIVLAYLLIPSGVALGLTIDVHWSSEAQSEWTIWAAEVVRRVYSSQVVGVPLEIAGIVGAIITGFVYARILKQSESNFGTFERLTLWATMLICAVNLVVFFLFPHDSERFLRNVVSGETLVPAVREAVQSTLKDGLILVALILGIRSD